MSSGSIPIPIARGDSHLIPANDRPHPPTQAERLILIIFLGLLAIGFLLTIRDGHEWGDDFAMYILHARNIAQGIKYQNTGYIYNPQFADLGPKNYPPLYPCVLAPVVKYFGLNFRAMKVETVLLFVLILLVLFYLFWRVLPGRFVFLLLVAVGTNHLFWEAKDQIGSDMLFILSVYVCCYAVEKSYENESPPPPALGLSVGLIIYLVYATRSIGLVLIPSLLAYDLARCKRISRFGLVATAFALVGIAAQNRVVQIDSSYLEQFQGFHLRTLLANVLSYGKSLALAWSNGHSRSLANVLYMLSIPPVVAGAYLKWRRRVAVYDYFVVFYLGGIMVWPSMQGIRFLLPIVPLYVLYLLIFICTKAWAHPVGKKVAKAAAALSLLTYIGAYSKTQYGPIETGIRDPEFAELCRYIREHTSPDDIFIVRKPRVLALFAGRSAAAYNFERAKGEVEFWQFIDFIKPTYIVRTDLAGTEYDGDRNILTGFLSSNPSRLRNVYHNREFGLFKIAPRN